MKLGFLSLLKGNRNKELRGCALHADLSQMAVAEIRLAD